MKISKIFSEYGLIGDDLELRKNILIIFNEDGRIKEIQSEDPEEFLSFRPDNHSAELLLPGLINSHIHIADSFAKEFGYNQNLIKVVAPPDGLKHRLLDNVSENILIQGIQQSVTDLIRNGIICFNDFREGGLQGIKLINKALENKLIKKIIFGRFNSQNEINEVFKLADGIGLSSYSNISNNEKKILRENKKRFNKPIACHVAEVNRNLALFDQIINDDLVDIIVHGTKFQKYELEEIKRYKKGLIICPRSNAYFGVGVPPIRDILNLKIPIAIGTDNIMANSPNLFEELRFIYYLLKIFNNKQELMSISSKDLLKLVTINAAHIFNMESDIGSISIGKKANFFKVSLKDPNFFVHKLNKDLFHAFIIQRTNQNNINKVFIKGKKIYEH